MSKIVKNNTASPLPISDTGITISASGQYTIPPQDYLLWAASDDIITEIGNGNATINDGSNDLSINDGAKLIQGIFPNPVGIEGSDGTQIGNVGDSLKAASYHKNPQGTLDSIYESGVEPNNITNTPLLANQTWYGQWFEASSKGFVSIMSSALSDVSGTLFVDLSEVDNPTNNSNVDVNGGFSVTFDPSVNPVARRITPLQSKWVRLRYVNGNTNQTTFFIHNTLYKESHPLVMQRLSEAPQDFMLAGLTKSLQAAQDPNGNYKNERADGYKDEFTTNTPLANGASFQTGIVDMSDYNFLINELAADQNLTLTGEWFDDMAGTNLIRTFTFQYTEGDLSTTGTTMLSQYLRYTITNNSGVNCTYTRVRVRATNTPFQGQILPLESFIPSNVLANVTRSVLVGVNEEGRYVNIKADNQDSLKVSSVITDKEGNDVAISNFSELRVAERKIDLQAKFIYGVSSILFNKTATNGGFLTEANQQAQISTGTNSAGKYVLQSKKYINYRVSEANEFSITSRFPFVTGTVGSQTGIANSRALAGVFTDGNDGVYIGFKNDSKFSVFYITNGTETQIEQGNFSEDQLDGTTVTNGITSQYTPDWTKIQIIRITYSWHGAAAINYQIQKPNEEWITFHREFFINTSTTPSIGTPFLPITALVENTGNTTNIEFDLQAAQASFIGDATVTSQAKGFSVDTVKSVTTEVPILSIRNNTTFNGINNGIRFSFQTIGIATDGNKSVVVRAYVDSTLTGASFTNVSATESVASTDTSATAFSGGLQVATVPLAKVESYNDDISSLDLEVQPGQTVTFTATSSSTNEVTIGVRWRELH